MPVSLSTRNVPDDVAARLGDRAEGNRRPLRGELLTIIEAAATTRARRTPRQVIAEAARLLPARSDESAAMIRADRDAGHGG